jgi:hypothetical protein
MEGFGSHRKGRSAISYQQKSFGETVNWSG